MSPTWTKCDEPTWDSRASVDSWFQQVNMRPRSHFQNVKPTLPLASSLGRGKFSHESGNRVFRRSSCFTSSSH